MDTGPFRAFFRDRLQKHPTLICPMRVLWQEYLSYCKLWGFKPGEPADFVLQLALDEEVTIKEGGQGRLRRVAIGVGFQASPLDRREVG